MTAQTRQKRVFLSVGRAETAEHKQFIAEIEQRLKMAGLEPRRATYSSVQPLKKIREELETCDAAVVIAFERLYADRAIEFKDTPKANLFEPLKATTVWNHIEAAMAYSSQLPILTIAQNGCRNDGMLDAVSEWKVCWIDFDPAELSSERFEAIFSDWLRRIEDRQRRERPVIDLDRISELRVFDILGSLRAGQLATLGGGVAAIFAAGFAFTRLFPS